MAKFKADAEARRLQIRNMNREATLLVYSAVEDYMLARVGIQSHIFAGLVPAHQAVEKLLKAYLILGNPSTPTLAAVISAVKSVAVRQIGLPQTHNLTALYSMAAQNQGLSTTGPAILQKLEREYIDRYPDNPHENKSTNSSIIDDIDELIFGIWDWFESVNDVYYLTQGLNAHFYSAMVETEPAAEIHGHFVQIIGRANKAFIKSRSINVQKLDAISE